MANSEQVINLDVKTTGIKEATKQVSGLGKIVQKLSGMFNKVFSPEKILDCVQSAVQFSGALDKELLVLQQGLRALKTAVGDAVTPFGGKTIGFNLKPVHTPQIPYLAQGAVLPANRPFLAVVGDQKHGTNVEAPLATIQQAVANVMGDQTAAILAGFATSVEVQREILQAVLGIQIGDDVIGKAMHRYQQKMTVLNGGAI